MRNSGKGWVTSEYGMLPRATLTRTSREAARGKVGGRTHEIQRLIGRSIVPWSISKNSASARCGSTATSSRPMVVRRTASITGGFIAMALALQKLVAAGTLKALPCATSSERISVGIVENEVLLDLAYEEDSRAEVDMNFVLTGSDRFIEIQATAEQIPFTDEQLVKMTQFARIGIKELAEKQRAVLNAAGVKI